MLNRLRRALDGAGRYRQALLVLVLAGTVLNVWAALDAVSRVQSHFFYDDGTYLDVSKPPFDPSSAKPVEGQPHLGPGWHTVTPANPLLSSNTPYDQWRTALATYHKLQLRSLEPFAKIEFALLAGAVCGWLILPTAKVKP